MTKDPNAPLFARAIANVRKQKRWTQRELAEHLQVTHAMVNRWEKGYTMPRNYTLDRIAQALDLSVEELLAAETRPSLPQANPVADPELAHCFEAACHLDAEDRQTVKNVIRALTVQQQVRQLGKQAG